MSRDEKLDRTTSIHKEKYLKILNLDQSIRFVGRIKNRNVTSFIRRENSEPFLDEEMGIMTHYQASVKASMEEMFDEPLWEKPIG